MKKKYSLKGILLPLFFLTSIIGISQSVGDITFIAFNTDGDKDFAIVALANITPNSTIYFTDDETNGSGGFIGSEGIITWSSGSETIAAGTVVLFTDVDHNANLNFGASIGSITRTGAFGLSGNKDGIIAYIGTDATTPTTYLAAIQIGNANSELGPFDGDGITLTSTGLTIGTTIVVIDNVASPDGGKYAESRSNKTAFSEYLTSISDTTKWTTVSSSGDGETLVPFSQEAFTTDTTVWTGGTNAVWNLAENWDNGIPTSSSLTTIPNVATSPIISSGTTAFAGNITIDASEILTINSANSLTVSGVLIITGALTINSGGSLLLNGTSSGNLTYNVNVNNTDWHLVSSPIVGEQYDDAWNTTNSITVSGTLLNDAVSTYNNTTSTGGTWDYFQTGAAATTFNQGQGYSLKRTEAGNYGFIGVFPTSDIQLSITQGFGALNNWNLVGNPFPSYIKVSELIAANRTNLTNTHEFVYVWDGTNYTALNGTDYIHPGQGFFVNADNSNANNFAIAQSLQSHQTGITFYKETVNPTIKVFVTAKHNTQKFTEIRYIENTTKELDPGFDAGTFTAQSTNFSVFSHLVSNSEGIDFMLQSLPKDDYENTIIPIGFNAVSGKEITFSIKHQSLPDGLMVFIEDRTKNNITRVDESNSEYKITLDSDNNGVGRLYLRTSTTDLRKEFYTDDYNTRINMYMTAKRTLRITGVKSSNANITLYNILGEKILNRSFSSSSIIDLELPSTIRAGIYLVKLETKKGNTHKKLFIQ